MSYPVIETFFSSQYVNKACVFTQNLFISVSFSACPKEKRYFDISFFIKQSKTIKIHEISIDFLYLLLDIYKILHLILSISSIQSPYYINYIYFNDLHTTYCIVIIIFLMYLLIITNVICYYFDLLIIAKKDL